MDATTLILVCLAILGLCWAAYGIHRVASALERLSGDLARIGNAVCAQKDPVGRPDPMVAQRLLEIQKTLHRAWGGD